MAEAHITEEPIRTTFRADSIRMAEMHYQLTMWDERDPPRWLLYFVFRSLICWHIYERRMHDMHLPKANNILKLLIQHYPETLTAPILQIIMQSRQLNLLLTQAFDDDQWKRAFETSFSEEFQQEVFHWNGNDYNRSSAKIDFLSHLFQVNIDIISSNKQELLYSCKLGLPNRPKVQIYLEKSGSWRINTAMGSEKQIKRPPRKMFLSAFAHVSNRIIAHKGVSLLIKHMLVVMRQSRFWDELNSRYTSWLEQLNRAHKDVCSQTQAYRHKEAELNLPTASDQGRRPDIPPLQVLIPGIRAIINATDKKKRENCDVRVKMSIPLTDPYSPNTRLNLKDIRPSKDNWMPKYMFIVGGNSFTRGTTLSDPLVTVFTRHSDNQEELTQYMRMLGHRKPEAMDLMCAIGGYMHEVLYKKLWVTTSNNVILLLDSIQRNRGKMSVKTAPLILQTPGMVAAPRSHMYFACVVKRDTNKITVRNDCIQGNDAEALFNWTNSLFKYLLEKYANQVHMPGKLNSHGEKHNIYRYSSPGIVFRNVLVDQTLLSILRNQEKLFVKTMEVNTFSALLAILMSGEHKINICFDHKKGSTDDQLKDNYGALLDCDNILNFVAPLHIASNHQIRTDVADSVDAMKLRQDVNKKQYEVMPDYEHYIIYKGEKKERSCLAPPLLHITLVIPTQSSKNIQNGINQLLPAFTLYPPRQKHLLDLNSIVVPKKISGSTTKRHRSTPMEEGSTESFRPILK